MDRDFPSIFRHPDDDSNNEPYVKYEHEMFYDLVSRFPEQFSRCLNTFEHLVMMQHYGFPTRLLDVTSNPLVALYFACVDGGGEITKGDGIVTIYDMPKEQIKNYNSDTVTVLSNLARISEEYTPFFATYNSFLNKVEKIINDRNYKISLAFSPNLDRNELLSLHAQLKIIYARKRLRLFKEVKLEVSEISKKSINLHLTKKGFEFIKLLRREIDDYFSTKFSDHEEHLESVNRFVEIFEYCLLSFFAIELKTDLRFKHLLKEDKAHFIHENINPLNLKNFYAVKPKLNNPRIINQSGAFLLFGFANEKTTKITSPKKHLKLRTKVIGIKGSIDDGILIRKNAKQKIVDELKEIGIHRAFLFPEINNVSKVVANEYKFEKTKAKERY